MTSQEPIVFFDIANYLASVRVCGTEGDIWDLVAYPEVPEQLKRLRDRGARLGIYANMERIRPDDIGDALRRAGLLDYFDRDLLWFEHLDAPMPSGLATRLMHNMGRDGVIAPRVLFISTDACERAQGSAAGMLVAPHTALAEAVLFGETPLQFLQIHVPPTLARTDWRALLGKHSAAPLHVSPDLGDAASPVVYAVADLDTADRIVEDGFRVNPLGKKNEPLLSDPYLVAKNGDDTEGSNSAGCDGHDASDSMYPNGSWNELAFTREGLLVAVPAGGLERFHLRGPPGIRSRKLVPSMALLKPALPLDPSPFHSGATDRLGDRILSSEEIRLIRRMVRRRHIRMDVDRYSGMAPLRRDVTIVSREMIHPHNREAVCALAHDLESLGGGRLRVCLHPFKHYGFQLANVEATLPASGLDGVVVVGAHLDSTVEDTLPGSPPHNPEKDPAPGADDNASGIAGVLCAARVLLRLSRGRVKHRKIRFVLFNGEEYSLSGSQAYALDRRQVCDKIVAVFNMDMIGYDAVLPSFYEVHAGGDGEAQVMKRSIELARLVESVAREVCIGRLVAQLDLGIDRPDPAATYSDHSSFHRAGFPACLVSEDFHKDLGANPPKPDRAPGYHRCSDTVVHPSYAADIARAVAAAAWVEATRLP